jgi:VanZ family protein
LSARTKIALAWAPAVLYMAAIWTVSSFAIEAPPFARFSYSDKLVHFLEYGILGFLLAHATLRTWPRHHGLRTTALAILIAGLWGWLDEVHQALVPGRSSEALDLAADVLGSFTGASMRYVLSLKAPRVAASEDRG